VTAADLHRLIASLPPNRRVTLTMVQIDGSDVGTILEPATATPVARPVIGDEPTCAAPTPIQNLASSPVDLAKRIVETDDGALLTVAEWTARLGGAISIRELNRAVAAKAVVSRERGTGRGHCARVIVPTEMLAYLELREACLEGRARKPHWFGTVVKEAVRAA
jgi:hypothetical protein